MQFQRFNKRDLPSYFLQLVKNVIKKVMDQLKNVYINDNVKVVHIPEYAKENAES